MSFFVDANVIVYARTDGPRREPCQRILAAIATDGAAGVTSAAVLEEVWHLELSGRVGDLAGQTRLARVLFDDVVAISAGIFDGALAMELPAGLGANDRLHLAVCAEQGIDVIVTADLAFDGAMPGLRRADPLDDAAVSELLGRKGEPRSV